MKIDAEVSTIPDQVLSDLVRIGLARSDSSDVDGVGHVLHGDLALFLPLLTGFDVRLVPMIRANCPVKFCTGILKLPASSVPGDKNMRAPIPAGGQADTLVDASFGCIGELTERLSLCSMGESESRACKEVQKLPQVEMASILGLSESQSRNAIRQLASRGVNLDANAPDWGSISDGRLLLTQLGFGTHAQVPGICILFGELEISTGLDQGFASSVGCAVWRDHEGARQRALLELVERDAVAQAWYNRLGITELDRDQVKSFLAESLSDFVEAESRCWGLYVVDTELHVHVVMAISYDSGGRKAAFGSAAGWDMSSACTSAVEELLQSENALTLMERAYPDRPNTVTRVPDVPRQLVYARQHSITADLLTCAKAATDTSSYGISYSYDDLLQSCLDRDIEIWEFDATRPDLRVPCVKLISKDLCSWEPRFGKERLYQGVVDRGLRKEPGTEAEFEQRPFPF
ncbi:YcaO-like family protein [Labrenzia sp. DG1229]|uniref:YcaO-like family protein n=1 Tax=Labrenzia sp. DG1229 TaxID=681847 RepID=UPI000490C2E1|nr:YcaO-like family protein [Labrenzia sp. DG1229]